MSDQSPYNIMPTHEGGHNAMGGKLYEAQLQLLENKCQHAIDVCVIQARGRHMVWSAETAHKSSQQQRSTNWSGPSRRSTLAHWMQTGRHWICHALGGQPFTGPGVLHCNNMNWCLYKQSRAQLTSKKILYRKAEFSTISILLRDEGWWCWLKLEVAIDSTLNYLLCFP